MGTRIKKEIKVWHIASVCVDHTQVETEAQSSKKPTSNQRRIDDSGEDDHGSLQPWSILARSDTIRNYTTTYFQTIFK